ncbi:transglutaminase-like domain-containing protein [Actinokineospora terrae]|uniref:Transglutaminase-like superfamily protein n=1 Tax=Actinokineospora terrae TaxID=155974 RepID=A0A1H9X9K4_9PSEU|nr:transglutaminase-like domain-containing protein [Actinokineospora terrae]SES42878.1 Transglutaminase-like superfamily protein [Actinokineospora terrae]
MSSHETVELKALTAETEFLDYNSDTVREFVAKALPGEGQPGEGLSDTEKAVRLYYAVRDGINYEVYGSRMTRGEFTASAIIKHKRGFCVHKSIVYAAAVRAVGVPSRIVYGDVRNHLSSERLRELVGGDVFCFHSLTSVHLDGRWVKATPVFNKLLCKLYKIAPLEFDGTADSLYHPYDENGRRHMEFLRMRGEFDDFPYETVVDGIRAAHPKLFRSDDELAEGSLTGEAS